MKIARAIMDGLEMQRLRDELSLLRYALEQDWDDGLQRIVDHDAREPLRRSTHPVRARRPGAAEKPPMIVWRAPIQWSAVGA